MLEALERQGRNIPVSCRAGSCHSCLLQALDGSPGPDSQLGLRDTMRAAGYFLACRCRPDGDLTIGYPGGDVSTPARISSVNRLGHRTLDVRLTPERRFDYRPGQFVTLLRDDLLARSYSLASLPSDGELRLHVRHHPGGAMSGWLAERATPGERVTIQGPYGNCFYLPGRPEQPMLLAGTGTGLAPLYGILRDALSHGHTGPIRLVHGALDSRGLYLVDELSALAGDVSGVEYHRCVLRATPDATDMVGTAAPVNTPCTAGTVDRAAGIHVGDLVEVVARLVPRPAGYRVFLCGDPEVTHGLRRALFVNGASNRDIYLDAFTPSSQTTTPRPARP